MKIYILICAVLITPVLYADQSEYLFEQGVQAYQQGDYNLAVEHFESVLQHGKASSALYYNLANAYYKNGAIGESILFYERALKITPHDDDILYNLQIARLQIVDKIASPENDFFYRIWENIKKVFSIQLLSLVTLLVYITLILNLILLLLITNGFWRTLMRWILVPVIIALLVFGIFFAVQLESDIHDNYGIIVADKVSINSGPSKSSTEVFALHEGVKVKIIDRSGEYVRLRLTDGKDGWAPVDAVVII